MKSFAIKEEYIQLDQLLKALKFVSSGGMAHLMVDDGLVKVNGFVEMRRRAKIRVGDVIEVDKNKVVVVAG
jgi:ribosome-associated protein